MIRQTLATVLTLGFVLTGVSSFAASKPKDYAPAQTVGDRCGYEFPLKGKAEQLQEYLQSVNNCLGPSKVANSTMSKLTPKSQLTSRTNYTNLSQCKLPQPSGLNEFRGFPVGNNQNYAIKHHPAAGSVIQVVGISSIDAPAGKELPAEDYKYYLDNAKAWFASVNNSNQPVTFRVANKWYDLGEEIAPFHLTHKGNNPSARTFAQKVVSLVDKDIDFKDVGYVLVVLPSKTPFSVAEQSGLYGAESAEGQIYNMSLAMPANFKKGQRSDWSGFLGITMWIHELYHPGFNMGDQPGDQKWVYENRGMGQWGMFAGGNTDLLQWQKWLLGFTTDSQVACVPTDSTSVTWLAPGSTKTGKQKLLVIPFSATDAVIVESVRATGLNYKLARSDQGALVYTIDMTETRYDFGYEVQFPENRAWIPSKYAMGTAPLKKGETFKYKGVKVTNVEWGDFGDVIKVEPIK